MVLPGTHFTLHNPEGFLLVLRDALRHGVVSLPGVSLAEMWSLGAVAALARGERPGALRVEWDRSDAARFAEAVGFYDVIAGAEPRRAGEEGRTVRLCRVNDDERVMPLAYEIAALLAANQPARLSAGDTIAYVLIELMRNVIQHAEDPLGAVVGAQLNDRGLHVNKPVFQVVVADAGQTIRAHLSRTHPELDTDELAVERCLWPHVSGAFSSGGTGGTENAGLGLFYISEMAKELNGRLLIASGAAAIEVNPETKQRERILSVGYPGTLVAFEIPAESPIDFGTLFESIGEKQRQRAPRPVKQHWLSFETVPDRVTRFVVSTFVENNEEALQLARTQLIPRLMKKEPVALDFVNVRLLTQSFAHALLFEPLRIAWAMQTTVFISNATPVVRSALSRVEEYSQH
jgi:hypothetical protein